MMNLAIVAADGVNIYARAGTLPPPWILMKAHPSARHASLIVDALRANAGPD